MRITRQELLDTWDPRSPAVRADQIKAYDAMRQRCPVAHSESLHWSVLGHAQVMRVLHDPATFSSAASTHRSVPNGMDPPQHTRYRRLIDAYFDALTLAAHEPACRRIAQEMVDALPAAGEVEWMDRFARECVMRMLGAFMGWPAALHEPLRQWARKNQAATLAQDRVAMADIAFEFDGHIRAQLAIRKAAGPEARDVTSRLLRERIDGQPLSEAEIVSIVRNWTVGELSTMAACVGILANYLALHPALQQALRSQPGRLPAAIDEILRIDPPLIANRRVVRHEVELGGQRLAPGDKVSLLWASANRDEAVFGNPDEFRPDRDPSLNLLYGAGIHVCPGAPLARMQLRLVMEMLLDRTRLISRVPGKPPAKACYPVGGYSSLPLRIEQV
ncbi:MAG TPA: cytochrome P450 [Ramlibacter sp.]|nr:cytochrome P450 [Ramlibacter sp.]